jgi:hypothetical protein
LPTSPNSGEFGYPGNALHAVYCPDLHRFRQVISDQSEPIIQALNEIRDEVRALRAEQSRHHEESQRGSEQRQAATQKYYDASQKSARRSSAQTWVSYLALLTLLLSTAIVILLWNR